jgi:hypothetical protein
MNLRNVALNMSVRSSIKYPAFRAVLRILTGFGIRVLNSLKWTKNDTTVSQ